MAFRGFADQALGTVAVDAQGRLSGPVAASSEATRLAYVRLLDSICPISGGVRKG